MGDLTILTASSGLSDIKSFFDNYGTTGDVDGALMTTAFLFKAVLWILIVVGAVAMAIWILRIAVDILMIVGRGTFIENSKLKSWATGSDGYADVKSYITKNGVQIIIVIVFITFLITGWLFRIVAIALSGFGALGEKLLGLDIESVFTTTEVTSYVEQLPSRRAVALKSEYDEMVGNVRSEAARLYGYAKEGKLKSDPNYAKSMKLYTNYIYRAQAISKQMTGEKVSALNIQPSYFKQHLSTKGDEICNKAFIDKDTEQRYLSAKVNPIACSK